METNVRILGERIGRVQEKPRVHHIQDLHLHIPTHLIADILIIHPERCVARIFSPSCTLMNGRAGGRTSAVAFIVLLYHEKNKSGLFTVFSHHV